jgi:four helix bundle protein
MFAIVNTVKMKSYKDLDIYNLACHLSISVHFLSLTLPNYELYETGSQVRRSSKSIATNIVEGYGRKKFKGDFIKFLIYAQASCDETLHHLTVMMDIHLKDDKELIVKYDELGRKIFTFIKYVEDHWTTNQ